MKTTGRTGLSAAGLLALALLCGAGVVSGSVFASAPAMAQEVRERVFPQGIGIGVVPPADMALSQRFPGFEDEARESAIMLVEMPPEMYAGVERDLRDPQREPDGFTLLRREAWPVEGGKGLLVEGRQEIDGKTVYKWVLARGTAAAAAAVTFQVSEQARDVYTDDVVLRTLRSLALRDAAALEAELATLPFVIGQPPADGPAFRVSRVIANNSAMLTLGPKDLVQGAEQPVIVIGGGTAAIAGALEQDRFARQAFAGLTSIRNMQIRRGEGVTHGGVAWHEIEADAQDEGTGARVRVMQAIRFDRTRFIRFVVVARQGAWDEAAAYFKHLRETVQARSETTD
ncbi:MAG: hypothetical protein ACOYJQ_07405 [Pseudochelatococcus sp.]|uniref:hypothetical protein n=1 Tax=Pseudochelatococcus sp. TaxID=2020869 RepID=UPI003D8AC867